MGENIWKLQEQQGLSLKKKDTDKQFKKPTEKKEQET